MLQLQLYVVTPEVVNYLISFCFNLIITHCHYHTQNNETAWLSGQRVGLAIRWSRVRVPLWPLAGFVLGCPELKSSASLANSQLVASCQLGLLILLCLFELFVSKYLSGVPVN